MSEDNAFRELLTCLPTYLQRDGDSVCTTCGAVVGTNSSDQIRHTAWHTMLAALLPPGSQASTDDRPTDR
jgi:hypothetical protein